LTKTTLILKRRKDYIEIGENKILNFITQNWQTTFKPSQFISHAKVNFWLAYLSRSMGSFSKSYIFQKEYPLSYHLKFTIWPAIKNDI